MCRASSFGLPDLGATLVTSGVATSDGAGLLTSAINTPSEQASDKFTLAPQGVAYLQCQYPNYLGPAAFDFRIVVQEGKGALTAGGWYTRNNAAGSYSSFFVNGGRPF